VSSSQGIEALTHLALRVPAVVIASWACGEQFQRWRLPAITGYLLTGLLAGPWVLGLINPGGLPLVSALHTPRQKRGAVSIALRWDVHTPLPSAIRVWGQGLDTSKADPRRQQDCFLKCPHGG
jgi:hypothetical protein